MEHIDYEKQAQKFLGKTGTTFSLVLSHHGRHWAEDTEERDIYNITLKRGKRSCTFKFGQSLVRSKGWREKKRPDYKLLPFYHKILPSLSDDGLGEWVCKGIPPTPYGVLSTLTKRSPGLFEEFCMDFGYDQDSRRAEKVYREAMDIWLHLSRLFSSEELEEMEEIQ